MPSVIKILLILLRGIYFQLNLDIQVALNLFLVNSGAAKSACTARDPILMRSIEEM